ncbi:MAG: N-acetylmuramoyl-L-alanine amidase [Coriobacteriaceae bacterium]|nr:N-acetylmuramoyl-L-alanine amidase [Coriobacteriaceae bacterium]
MVAAHFVVGVDGVVVQCVPLDTIAHHAGFGNAGHNSLFDTPEDGRDDKLGTTSIGGAYPDYGMNSYSVGIEMVHIGGSGYYPEAQLNALDSLIAYIDAYYGFESKIIDHKAWRTSNSDTSAEFAEYLRNYQSHRTHS